MVQCSYVTLKVLKGTSIERFFEDPFENLTVADSNLSLSPCQHDTPQHQLPEVLSLEPHHNVFNLQLSAQVFLLNPFITLYFIIKLLIIKFREGQSFGMGQQRIPYH